MNFNPLISTFSFIRYAREERSVRAGAGTTIAAGYQILMTGYAIKTMKGLAINNSLFKPLLNLGYCSLFASIVGIAGAINIRSVKKISDFFLTVMNHELPTAYYLDKIFNIYYSVICWTDKQMESHLWVRKSVYTLHDKMETIAQGVMFATSLGIMASASMEIGAVILALMVTDLLCQRGLLGFAIRSRFYPMMVVASTALQLLTGNYIEKGVSILAIGNYVYSKYREYYLDKNKDVQALVGQKVKADPITCDIKSAILVNEQHIRPVEIVEEPQIDLASSVHKMWAEIKLNRTILFAKAQSDEALIKKIKGGEISFGNDDDQKEAVLKQYVSEGIEKFTSRIVNREIKEGEPTSAGDYDKLRIMAKAIVQALEKEEEMIKHDTLIALALAGHYCGTGFFREVEGLYQVFVDFNSATLQGSILACLRHFRDIKFQSVISLIQKSSDKRAFNQVQYNDVHNYNKILWIFARNWGLSYTHGAKIDHGLNESLTYQLGMACFRKIVAMIRKSKSQKADIIDLLGSINEKSKISDWAVFLAVFLYDLLEKIAEEAMGNNIKSICECIIEDLNNKKPIILYTKLREWYIAWLQERKNINKEEATEFFQENIIIILDNGGYEIERSYLLLMLVELGILQVPADSPLLISNLTKEASLLRARDVRTNFLKLPNYRNDFFVFMSRENGASM
jgi:hypothetical protein